MPDLQPPSGCSTGCGAGTTFDQATNVTSHELSESVTDPDVGPATTFARPLAWIDQANGEIGDICVAVEAAVVANGTTYTVQQEFSNLQNNCVAAPPTFQIIAGPNVSGGQSFDLDLRIEDSNSGATIPYTGIVHFTSSDSAAVLPADYTFTLADAGFHLSCKSDYLLERNWIQICLMGQYTRETIDQMLATLGRCTSRAPRSSRG